MIKELPQPISLLTCCFQNNIKSSPKESTWVQVQVLLDLENKLKVFKAQVNQEHNFCKMNEAMDNYVSFNEAWSLIRLQYPLLCTFFGELESAFPGTSTVESDFLSSDMKKTIIGHH
jgi:hypothetical protein